MPDLSITAANVVAGSGASIERSGTGGESITAGSAVYKDSNDSNEYKLAEADDSNAKAVYGIALHNTEDGQPLAVIRKGNCTIGATLTQGEIYLLSPTNTGGKIMPVGDVANTDNVVIVGYATNTTNLFVQIIDTGVVHG